MSTDLQVIMTVREAEVVRDELMSKLGDLYDLICDINHIKARLDLLGGDKTSPRDFPIKQVLECCETQYMTSLPRKTKEEAMEKSKNVVDAYMWMKFLDVTRVSSFMTAKKKDDLDSFLGAVFYDETHSHNRRLEPPINPWPAFSSEGAEEVVKKLMGSSTDDLQASLIDVYQKFSYQDYMKDKNLKSSNTSGFKEKIIVQGRCTSPMYNSTALYIERYMKEYLFDLCRVLSLCDGGKVVQRHDDGMRWLDNAHSKPIETKYFTVSLKKNGNIHIRFKDLDLIKQVNLFMAYGNKKVLTRF